MTNHIHLSPRFLHHYHSLKTITYHLILDYLFGGLVNSTDVLVLRGLRGVGDETLIALLDFAKANSISSLESLAKADISAIPLRQFPPSLLDLMDTKDFSKQRERFSNEQEKWKSDEINLIVYGSEGYPEQLLDLLKPPPILFCRGNLDLLGETRAIAVVGTRKNTPLGAKITNKSVEAFGGFGFSIVSGLALGIDTIAHKSALECNAPTIAVLVDVSKISPSTNINLAQGILDNGGLLIAENPPGIKVIPAYFAKRDRIQAGLSKAVFAIETAINGGTMHAVNAAKSMGRPVYVPDASQAGYSDLEIPAISGTQWLVDEGIASPYTRASYPTILETLDGPNGSSTQGTRI
ncbi:MAG: DNA-processing protein DprA [Pseudomonadota bacterium]